jgi:hypothetical protein
MEALNKWPLTRAIGGGACSNMPRLRQDIGSAVFYLYGIDPKTGSRRGPLGSGFVVARPSTKFPNFRHYYGVSNWHLTHDIGASIIRINTDKGSRFIDKSPEDWHFEPNGDDLSIIDLTDEAQSNDQVAHYVDVGFADRSFLKRFEVSVGEDAFMTGLFAANHGGERNAPVARFGNVSLLASDDILIEQPNGIARPSHLVDMRSRTGFSGSPVAIYRVPGLDLSDIPPVPRPLPLPNDPRAIPKFIALFGVHCGQFYDPVKVSKSPPKRHEREGDAIVEGDRLYIQSGMTIVVPAWRITELMNLDAFEVARKNRENRSAEAAMSRPQPEALEVPQGRADEE